MTDVTLTPFARPFAASIAPPGSKSLTNRALVIAALGDGKSTLSNVLFADDTEVMIAGLEALGFKLHVDRKKGRIKVDGKSGAVPAKTAEIDCGNSGTTIRFLAALCALGTGTYRLTGVARMRERPIGELGELLTALGGKVRYEEREGYPPIVIEGAGLPGGRATFPAAHSSQYLSAVLLAAPYAAEDVVIDLEPEQTSWPYVEMTARLMLDFGVQAVISLEHPGERPGIRPVVRPKQIRAFRGVYWDLDYAIEPDASNATYFMAAAAIRPGARVTIPGLGRSSLQGDVGFSEVLQKMGATVTLDDDAVTVAGTEKLHGIDVDMAGMPDAAMTLAAIAVFAHGRTTIRGLHTFRVKETDRLAAIETELRKLGATVEIHDDTLHIDPPHDVRPADIDTYEDHRMAMAFAVVGTRAEGITIRGAECVSKTYPRFFEDMETLRGG
ncbi:MAG: 3-phosphoshikimate 1-carboxyvinyltransferase [Chloroflexota bacterium]